MSIPQELYPTIFSLAWNSVLDTETRKKLTASCLLVNKQWQKVVILMSWQNLHFCSNAEAKRFIHNISQQESKTGKGHHGCSLTTSIHVVFDGFSRHKAVFAGPECDWRWLKSLPPQVDTLEFVPVPCNWTASYTRVDDGPIVGIDFLNTKCKTIKYITFYDMECDALAWNFLLPIFPRLKSVEVDSTVIERPQFSTNRMLKLGFKDLQKYRTKTAENLRWINDVFAKTCVIGDKMDTVPLLRFDDGLDEALHNMVNNREQSPQHDTARNIQNELQVHNRLLAKGHLHARIRASPVMFVAAIGVLLLLLIVIIIIVVFVFKH
ncbi:hypothetical protein BDQ17DRAFT_1328374 [Cyathus striatus]|nr:hypothetical protein BDQ17DRAFT_1328374 [Cyathus striatus]